MIKINYSDDLPVRSRNLHLQTNTLDTAPKMICTLFDGGRVLRKKEIPYSVLLSDEELRQEVEAAHKHALRSIIVLYHITARVQSMRHATSQLRLGRQFLKWHLLDEAIAELQLAIQYDSSLGDAYAALIHAYMLRGSLEEAEETVAQGLTQCPRYADLLYLKGRIWWRLNRYFEAMETYLEALKINPRYMAVHAALTQCFLSIRQRPSDDNNLPNPEECLRRTKVHLSKAISLSEGINRDALETTMRYLHKDEENPARETIDAYLDELDEAQLFSFIDGFYLMFMYGDQGREAPVIDAYLAKLKQAIAEHPNYPDLQDHLGIAYLMQCREQFNQALLHFRQAQTLNVHAEPFKQHLKMVENEGKGFLLLLRALLK